MIDLKTAMQILDYDIETGEGKQCLPESSEQSERG